MNPAARYLANPDRQPIDLQAVIILTVLGAAFAFALPDGNWLRVALGICFIMFLPGYALVSVLWPMAPPGEDSRVPDSMERIALGFGLSLAVIGLDGLVLNYTSAGITPASVIISVLVLTLAFAVLAYVLRLRLPPSERFAVGMVLACPLKRMDRQEKVFAGVLAVALVLAGGTTAYMLAQPVPGEEFTEFYILDANGTARDYPVNLSAGEVGRVLVGVVCHEAAVTNYTILAGIEDANGTVTYGDWSQVFSADYGVIGRNITLAPGGAFEEAFDFRFTGQGTHKLVWRLLIDGQETDYEVHLWVETG